MKVKLTGVYKIENKASGDLYIGSCVDFKRRKNRHLRALRTGKHHSRFLQRAWNKYGEDSFIFEILEECSKLECISKENQYFDKLRPKYNMCPIAGRSTGYKHSKKSLQKMSRSLKGRKPANSNLEVNSKKVIMIDKDTGAELFEFNSLSAACRYCNRDHRFVSMITDVCNGKRRRTAFGYKWRFK